MNQIDPGEGWRLIDKERDVKKPGDEYFDNGWRPAGCNIGFLDGHTYRRQIEQERLEQKNELIERFGIKSKTPRIRKRKATRGPEASEEAC